MVLIWKTQGNNYTNLLKNGSPKNREFREILGDSDVGDFVMLVTLWWWLIWDVGGRIIMLATFFIMSVIFPMY